MPELNSDSPILEGLMAGQCFAEHDGIHCYPAIQTETGDKYIVKVISIPASAVQTEALILTGAISTAEDAKRYFGTLADEVVAETRTLNELALLEGFIGCEQVRCEEAEEAPGYRVYILSRYRDSVEAAFQKGTMTHLDAMNMGLDLCAALAACRRAGFLYVDLKPDNVFLNDKGSYCIGDIGFISLSGMKYASLPEKYRSSYTAPEMADCLAQPNETLDIFALGMVLYQAYNGGTLPFEGTAPIEILPPPMYADYELSEIIMKACDPDPAKRWADPAQIGQALTAYMQRNSVNATPIIPPAEPDPEEAVEETLPEESAVEEFLPEMTEEELQSALAEEDAVQPDEMDELRMIAALALEDSIPDQQLLAETEADPSDEETAQMLAQAEELMTLVPPEPVVAPEAVHVSIPTGDTESVQPEAPEQDSAAMQQDQSREQDTAQESTAAPHRPVKKKKQHHWGRLIAFLITLAILGGVGFGGYYYYNHYYLQHVDAIQITGTDSTATVTVISDIDESLLTLVCTDSYGNAHTSKLENGKAYLENLNPQTRYTVSLRIEGFHELRGEISNHFTTASRTEILSFQAVVGPTDGSAILSFTFSGPEPEAWKVICTADGQETLVQSFTGNTVTVTGLNVGSDYTFTLDPESELFMAGQTQINFTAVNLVFAKNPVIDACHDGLLHVTWSAPEGETVEYWTVRCFNATGYDVSITTSDTEYTFENVDHSAVTVVEITAAGMTKSVGTTVGANPITVWEFNYDLSDPSKIGLSWIYTGHAPEGGWKLTWVAEGVSQQTIVCEENSAQIPLEFPGCTYEFTLVAADGSPIFGGTFTLALPAAPAFSGFGLTAADLLCRSFLVPEAVFAWQDLTEEDFTSVFAPGDPIRLLLTIQLPVDESDSTSAVSMIVRDQEGAFVISTRNKLSWNTMRTDGACILHLAMPTEPGTYIMSLYLDGMHVCDLPITIT